MPDINDILYLEPAKAGNLDILHKYLGAGGKLTPAMKEFLKTGPKQRRGRPKTLDHSERDEFVATYVRQLEHDGSGTVDAVAKASTTFRVSESGVYRAIRKYKKYGLIIEDFMD